VDGGLLGCGEEKWIRVDVKGRRKNGAGSTPRFWKVLSRRLERKKKSQKRSAGARGPRSRKRPCRTVQKEENEKKRQIED